MLIITYIMGHTLTICEETLPSVLDAIKYSHKGQTQPFTSPRLANRQLKFYFSVFRSNIYEKILKWQQQTLHTSGKKENTWLLSFCAMLGFAMVLEEVQRTIMIQADAKAVKNEATWEQASTEASNACERIDERFKLLVGLFQCKYRDKSWGDKGSFGNSTPRFSDASAHKFLRDVRELLEENSEYFATLSNHPGTTMLTFTSCTSAEPEERAIRGGEPVPVYLAAGGPLLVTVLRTPALATRGYD
jgi:hypothetical protein